VPGIPLESVQFCRTDKGKVKRIKKEHNILSLEI